MTWHRLGIVILQISTSTAVLLIQSCTAAQMQSPVPQKSSEVVSSDWPEGAVAELVDNCRTSALASESKADPVAVTKACRCFADEVSTSYDLEHFEVFEEEIVASYARQDGFRSCP
ncbi:MAG: hypothetical protein RIR26_2696 [Pseudomonadota bacterium]|jgi:hypothetical protein